MEKFTFVTLSYNQEKYIIQHLESIKFLVIKYASDIQIEYILSDDGSKDNTVKFAKRWLDVNQNLFSRIVVLENTQNTGIVNNYLRAIRLIKTEKFKDLAADDLYLDFDFTSFKKRCDILISPAIGFNNHEIRHLDFYLFEKCANSLFQDNYNIIKKSLEYSNNIASPGVFLSTKLVNNDGMVTFLSKYKWIEDFTQWLYLFFVKKQQLQIDVILKPTVLYRLSDGITTNSNKLHLEFLKEQMLISEEFSLKRNRFYTILNPYVYYRAFDKIFNKLFINKKFKSDFELLYNTNSEYYDMARKHLDYLNSKEEEFTSKYQ